MRDECPEVEMLSAYVDHNVTAKEELLLEAHFAGCWLCRETVVSSFRCLTMLDSGDRSDSQD